MNRFSKPSQDTPDLPHINNAVDLSFPAASPSKTASLPSSNSADSHNSAKAFRPQPIAFKQATAIIDLQALRHNAQHLKKISPKDDLLVAVKANAYGHGIVEVALAIDNIADYFAVANVQEARELRLAGVHSAIVVLSEHITGENIVDYRELRLLPCLFADATLEPQLKLLQEKKLEYWLKINTGMNRLGVSLNKLENSTDLFGSNPPAVVMTHFSESETADNTVSIQQMVCFDQALVCLEQKHKLDLDKLCLSLSNSAATLKKISTRYRQKQVNRCGLALYGISPSDNSLDRQLKPVMSLHARVIDIKHLQAGESVGYGSNWTAKEHSVVATVGIGYGDGYPRHASNGTPVLVNGKAASIVGRVSMDMIGVDVTHLQEEQLVNIGDPVCLWGNVCDKTGEENHTTLNIDAVAKHCDTISYQLLTNVSPRVNRYYVD